MSFTPREWQRQASSQLVSLAKRADRTLVFGCPGAGKTFAGLYIAQRISEQLRKTSRIIVVTPNLAIKTQWIDRAAAMGIELREIRRADELKQVRFEMGFGGYVVSYQQACADVRLLLREDVERHKPFVAKQQGEDLYACIDDVTDKLERQLTDHKERLRNRKHHSA